MGAVVVRADGWEEKYELGPLRGKRWKEMIRSFFRSIAGSERTRWIDIEELELFVV